MNSHTAVERLARIDACAVSDALDSLGLAGVAADIVRRSTDRRVTGRVRTMKLTDVPPPGGSAVHLGVGAIAGATEHDVIVVEQRTGVEAAAWGGLLANAARLQGIRGVVVDGPVRDVDEYAALDFPVFSRSVTPRTARGRVFEASTDEPIEVAGIVVRAGDFVVADGSGVVFVAAGHLEDVLARAEAIVAKEARMLADIEAGKPLASVLDARYESMLGSGPGRDG